ncbi:hypothetical protein [Deinococcus frigens]|uniref:hypothetical protein n=1 Tax=Deinococcus frigens TaxID=249403 RepID=UPI0004969BD6|nr:hypothetical protein [Deinococcus frigens]
MIRSFDSGQQWNLQNRTVLTSPELDGSHPGLATQTLEAQSLRVQPLQTCPESLTRALLAEENRQTLKLVGRLRWATGVARN